jgi:hypothetical protein
MKLFSKRSGLVSMMIPATLLLASCVTETVESPSVKFDESAVISVGDPSAKVAVGSTFAWLPAAMRFYDDKRLADVPIKSLIEAEIVNNIKNLDMRIAESINGARYAVAYTAALESSLDDTEIIKRYGLLPGMTQVPVGDKEVEKGSLIIYVFDNRTQQIIWRSAAQVGVSFDEALEERKQRVQRIVAEMFQTFPVQKKVEPESQGGAAAY